jgi:NADH:ubiquinone oxidoreductase subunit H
LELDAGLVVTSIEPESIAESVGLKIGDRLHTLDGVRLDSPRDFLPQAQAETSVLEFSRAGFTGLGQVQIDRTHFQLLESGMAARALALLAGVALSLIWAARPPRFLLWIFGDKSRLRRGRVVWLSDVGTKSQVLAYPIYLTVVLAFWWMLEKTSSELLGLKLLSSLATGSLLLSGSAFLLGGKRSGPKGGFSLLGALSATVLRLLVLLPVIVATFARASEVGSLSLSELAREQSFWPGGWALVRSPFTFVLSLAYLVALLPLAGKRPPLEGRRAELDLSLILSRAAEWAGQLILVALWVAIFAGENSLSKDQLLLSGILLSLKIAGLAHVLAWLRARTGHLRLNESWGLFGAFNLVVSLGTAALSVGAVVSGIGDTHAELFALFAAALGASMLVLLLVSSQRSWAHMGRRIDPWI